MLVFFWTMLYGIARHTLQKEGVGEGTDPSIAAYKSAALTGSYSQPFTQVWLYSSVLIHSLASRSLSAYLLMSSTPTTNKRRISRRSSDQFAGLPLEPAKKPREDSDDGSTTGIEHDPASDDDVYVPSADPAASELSSASSGELDDDGDSDAVGAVAARAKAVATRNRAGGPAKWDAEAKRARYLERYGQMTPDAALGKFVV